MIGAHKVLAVIPARGGSKRIPLKNIKNMAGKPLIAWSIEEAKKSSYIDRLIVSTDSEEIADVARSYGAEVPFLRPPELAIDTARDYDMFEHVLQRLSEEGDVPDIVIQLRPTSPLRTVEHIDAALELLEKHPEADSVRTVTMPEQTPYKMYTITEEGFLQPLLSDSRLKESFNAPIQTLPPTYKHVGYADCMWHKTITEKKSMSGDRILPLVLEEAESGADSQRAWDRYEYLFSLRSKH